MTDPNTRARAPHRAGHEPNPVTRSRPSGDHPSRGDFLITVPANGMTGAEFFRALFPKPNEHLAAELATALAQHQAAIQRTYRSGASLWDQIAARKALKANYAAGVRAIEQRYAEQLTECHGDPLLKRRRAA